MFHKMRAHLTYANVMATAAVFMALGGGAYAALRLPANSVKSKHIADGQVKSADAQNDGLTGTDVREDTLGEVPQAFSAVNAGSSEYADNAGLLQTKQATDFVWGSPGNGAPTRIWEGQTSMLFDAQDQLLLSVPGWGNLILTCKNFGNAPAVWLNFYNNSGGALDSYRDDGSADPTYERHQNNSGPPGGPALKFKAGDFGVDRIVWHLVADFGGIATIDTSMRIQQTATDTRCYGVAQAVVRSGT